MKVNIRKERKEGKKLFKWIEKMSLFKYDYIKINKKCYMKRRNSFILLSSFFLSFEVEKWSKKKRGKWSRRFEWDLSSHTYVNYFLHTFR